MTWVLLLAAALLAGVAAAGVLRPFGRGRALTLERLADPLDDERASPLGALRDPSEEEPRTAHHGRRRGRLDPYRAGLLRAAGGRSSSGRGRPAGPWRAVHGIGERPGRDRAVPGRVVHRPAQP